MKISFKVPEDILYDYQKKFFHTKKRFAFIEAAPQVGKTDTLLSWILKQAIIGGPAKNYWWTAPAQRQAKDAFDRCVKRIQAANLPKEAVKIRVQEQSLELVGAGKIYFLSNDSIHTLVGITVHAVVVDEAAFVKEDAWHLILSRLATTAGPVRCISNVQGKSNWFYKACREAEKKTRSDTYYQRITCEDAIRAGLQSRENLESLKSQYTKARFEELYYCVASDATASVFDYERLYSSIIDTIETPEVAVYGIDLAKKSDYTVIIGLNWRKEVVYFQRFQKSWQDTKKFILDNINDIPTYIDSTGVGDPIVEDLCSVKSNVFGYTFTNKSKQNLIDALILGFNNSEIKLYKPYAEQIIEEFLHFESSLTITSKIRYEGEQGYHDDIVMALGLAVYNHNKTVSFGSNIITEVNLFPEQNEDNFLERMDYFSWHSI